MPAYVISEVEVLDEPAAARYRAMAEASIVRHGGRYLARGAVPHAPGGGWPDARRVVIVRFPTTDAARRWYDSADYAEARALAERALHRRLLFVPGSSG